MLLLDTEHFQPAHGKRLPGLQHRSDGLDVISLGRASRLIFYSTVSTSVLSGKKFLDQDGEVADAAGEPVRR